MLTQLCDYTWCPTRTSQIRGTHIAYLHTLESPLRWQGSRRIFVDSSLAPSNVDLFDPAISNEQIAAVFGVMAACDRHAFFVITQHPDRMRAWFAWIAEEEEEAALEWSGRDCAIGVDAARTCSILARLEEETASLLPEILDHTRSSFGLDTKPPARWPLPHVALGVRAHIQTEVDRRVPALLETPAAFRFLVCDPIRESLDARLIGCFHDGAGTPERPDEREDHTDCAARIEWLIATTDHDGSHPDARIVRIRSLRDQCQEAGVPFWLQHVAEQPVASPDPQAPISAEPGSWRWSDGLIEIPISAGPGSWRWSDGLIEIPYLDGVQHTAVPTWWPRRSEPGTETT